MTSEAELVILAIEPARGTNSQDDKLSLTMLRSLIRPVCTVSCLEGSARGT